MKSLLLKLFLCACVIGSSHGRSQKEEEEDEIRSALFVFGDSLYDAGNNNYINTTNDNRADFAPYGESFFRHPSGRFSDGRLIPDFIAEYAKLPLIEAYLKPGNKDFAYGANFASGGGGALVQTYRGFVIDLHMQLSYFNEVSKKLGDADKTNTVISNAVYMLSIGGNDYIEPLTTNPSFFRTISKQQYVDLVLGNITQVIKGVYDKGGRKFVFSSLPPLASLPSLRLQIENDGGATLEADVTDLATLHNTALPKLVKKLEAQLKGLKYTYFDFNFYFSERVNNPSKYGFKEGPKACCGSGPYNGLYSCGGKRSVSETYDLCTNPSEHVFFDSFHGTEQVYRQLAELLWSGNLNVIAPFNLKSLFKLGTVPCDLKSRFKL